MTTQFARSDFAAALAAIGFVFALLISKWAVAGYDTHDHAWQTDNRTGVTVKCTIVYINGDAVIRCPKGSK